MTRQLKGSAPLDRGEQAKKQQQGSDHTGEQVHQQQQGSGASSSGLNRSEETGRSKRGADGREKMREDERACEKMREYAK